MAALLHSAILGLPPARIGKVREVYDLGDRVLLVATDRISAYDCTMADGIPDKGRLLTEMSAHWFRELADVAPHHLVSTDDAEIAALLPNPAPELAGRTTLAVKTEPLPVEAIARGYMDGSLYKEYLAHGPNVHGLNLPEGLRQGEKLPEPIFTPATKATEGHDENISFARTVELLGEETAIEVRDKTLALYRRAAERAERVGLILADTKFEFGRTPDGRLLLIDEALTPDSSRYWDAATYAPGGPQPSFDKQYLRDWLSASDWDKTPPGPRLPEAVIAETRAKYVEAFERLAGRPFVC